eukprot:TRINITY_DN11182_c0_g1_i3.p1 TRINITY_DN11182_c0_g1~~TRINITY_DN11182_c0_g1_i3.p1  ORF type:complete len:407 (-),score=46.20 TRINITY_DN11182_c0_g1_i3:360-1580(-)
MLPKVLLRRIRRLGMLEGCGNTLNFCLKQVPALIRANPTKANKVKNTKYLARLHIQYCAILSQQSRHKEALQHSKYGIKYLHYLLYDLRETAERLLLATDVSLLESTASKLVPILYEITSRLIPEQPHKMGEKKCKAKVDMRNLLGYTSPGDSVMEYNVGSIMQLSPLALLDVLSDYDLQFELTREAILDKLALLVAAYFCISVEKRLLAKESGAKSFSEAEYYITKALELACHFLPVESPLVKHMYLAYQKNYAPIQEVIVRFCITIACRHRDHRRYCLHTSAPWRLPISLLSDNKDDERAELLFESANIQGICSLCADKGALKAGNKECDEELRNAQLFEHYQEERKTVNKDIAEERDLSHNRHNKLRGQCATSQAAKVVAGETRRTAEEQQYEQHRQGTSHCG